MTSAALRYLRAMALNNRWANHRLLAACAQLGQDELLAPRVGFFPSLIATLNHILIVDRFYVAGLEGRSIGPEEAFTDEVPCPTMAALRPAQAEVDGRLVAVCRDLAPERLGEPVRLIRADHVQVERCDRVLLHLFQHQVHHRGQAHAMLSGTGVAPPQLDELFLAEDAPLRAGDLAALGLTEKDIWPIDP
jgi:uncharacterized damage-inducible protein DinB